jgi:hypothetical protein
MNMNSGMHRLQQLPALAVFLALAGNLSAQTVGGKALSFGGGSNQVTVATDPSLELTQGTLEVWFNARWSTASMTYDPVLIANRNGAPTRYCLQVSAKLDGIIFQNGSHTASFKTTLQSNQWYHVALVEDGSRATAYVNGNPIGTNSISFGTASGLPLNLGGNGTGEFFKGLLDEVRIWGRALSAGEIIRRYNRRLTPVEPGLVAYYTCDDGSASTLSNQAAGGGLNGTINGATPTTEGAPLGTYFTLNASAPLTAMRYSTVAWGDYNQDGRLDAVVAGEWFPGSVTTYSTYLYANLPGGFVLTNSFSGVFYGAVSLRDIDGDGDLDLTVAGESSTGEIARVYRRESDNSFTSLSPPLTGLSYAALAWGDYDNNGTPDLLLAGGTQPNGFPPLTTLYRNDGSGGFAAVPAGLTNLTWAALAWGDYDNDGAVDLLAAGSAGAAFTTMLYHNQGGRLVLANTNFPGVSFGSVAWCDYDGDGDLDFVLSGQQDGGAFLTRIYRNDGNGLFTPVFNGLTPLGGKSVVWGDFDNDGRPDLVISGYTGTDYVTRIYRNDGNDVFTPIFDELPGLANPGVAWGDYDNDGRLDLLLAGQSGPAAQYAAIWHNECPVTNHAPTAPSLLATVVRTNSVLFTWHAAADAETPASGLTYNVRVGTAPGSNDVMSAQAGADGKRRVPEMGNAQLRTNAWLTGLQPGRKYYWSVQAVDSAFAGSAFAPEQSFVFSPKPVITSARRQPSGVLHLDFEAIDGFAYRVLGSTNLANWQSLGTAVTNAPGRFGFDDLSAAGHPRQFYRVVTP